jgi:hypothetical protein
MVIPIAITEYGAGIPGRFAKPDIETQGGILCYFPECILQTLW